VWLQPSLDSGGSGISECADERPLADLLATLRRDCSAARALEQEGYVQSKLGPRNSTLYLHIKPFPDRTPLPVVFAPQNDEDFEDEMDETLTKSLGTPPVLLGPPPQRLGNQEPVKPASSWSHWEPFQKHYC
jgi:hypothetical protein